MVNLDLSHCDDLENDTPQKSLPCFAQHYTVRYENHLYQVIKGYSTVMGKKCMYFFCMETYRNACKKSTCTFCPSRYSMNVTNLTLSRRSVTRFTREKLC